MNELFLLGNVKSVGGENDDYDIEFICSTSVIDRADEVIEQDGWELDNFKTNPVFLAQHRHVTDSGRSTVLGSFMQIGVTGGALVGRVKFADTELGREYKSLYRDKHMRAVSVGFMPKAGENRSGDKGRKVYHHTRQELYEVSAVAVGCNQEALARLSAMKAKQGNGEQGTGNTTLRSSTSLRSTSRDDDNDDKNIPNSLVLEMMDKCLSAIEELQFSFDERIDELKAMLPDGINEQDLDVPGEDLKSDDTRGDIATDTRDTPNAVTKAGEDLLAAMDV